MTRRDDDTILALHRLGELPPALRQRARDLLATSEGARRLAELEREAANGPSDADIDAAVSGIRRKLASAPDRRTATWSFSAAGAMFCLAAFILVVDPLPPRNVEHAEGSPPLRPAEASRSTESVIAEVASGADHHEAPLPRGTVHPETAELPLDGSSRPEVVAMVEMADDGLRTKGGSARMQVFRILPGGTATPLRDGDSATTGTIVQVAVTAAEQPTWIAVLSIDGAGSTTRHIPETGDSAVPVGSGLQPPHSFRIDDAPAFERFVLFRADHPFPLADAFAELRDASPKHADLAAQSILLVKNKVVAR